MYHSIIFGDKNTWDDWCLIPNGRPIFVPPTQKTNYLDIPGGDGSLDMSEALTGYPVYNNREGSFNLIIMNEGATGYPECNPLKLDDIYSRIMSHLHGKRMKAVLEDDPRFSYEGRFSVNGITAGSDWSTIEIGYNVGPYKLDLLSSIGDWLWNPFNFETDSVLTGVFKNISVSTTQKRLQLNKMLTGEMPVSPKFIVNATNGQGVYVRCVNPNLSIDKTKLIQNGSHYDSDIVFYGDNVDLYLYTSSGTGTVSIEFYPGRF